MNSELLISEIIPNGNFFTSLTISNNNQLHRHEFVEIFYVVSGSAIQLHDDCTVIVDEEAAAKLQLKDYYNSAFENDPKWDAYRNI